MPGTNTQTAPPNLHPSKRDNPDFNSWDKFQFVPSNSQENSPVTHIETIPKSKSHAQL